jgi:N-acetylglucosaminyldiphosphoundecaprenol N-acetyl-beta-D-mannosaminyltransferase
MDKLVRQSILGVEINITNMPQVTATIHDWIVQCDPHYVCVTPAHSIMDCYYNPNLLKVFNQSGLTTPDGMSVVWTLKVMGHKHVGRVYGPDLMHALCKVSLDRGYSHYFYGGAQGVVEELSNRLNSTYPGLQIAGHYTPPFGKVSLEENRHIIEQIRATSPDILWVGISSPRQELWMAEHVNKLDVPVLIGVGAAFDFLSGRKQQAPKWIQRSGLEWLYRFIREPIRMWPRYSRYPLFVLLLFAQFLGIRIQSKDSG